ncbi:alpha-L-fucosidase [Niabella yanshanensis]|uniref:alpha-L-fucosidase n=1 Tax=Niabella yanshanensis TaxID=577386 RepID=A0ABZ0W8D6_9BACT|nr:alpha-L-fucosidase [Niabella yanshanensis]WQD38321.1 alpha-L-fucosidase [Niabella yanshanensis]
MKNILTSLIVLATLTATAQQQGIHPSSTQYEWPTDPQVKQKLDQWQDQKFGMIIHWGLYAVPGIIESWSLCSEDWITRDSNSYYGDYKKWYWGLQKDFNPVNFNPDEWAKAAKTAGMKYLVFTTKHHDGFCMFDTKETDFKITNGPFKNHPKANVAKYVFDAFRKEGMMIGAYFSKPDWHSENYWWPVYETANRNNNYDIRKFPWRWEKFKQYTYNQISELMTGYGCMDILWLDGGWVRPKETVNAEVLSWGAPIPEWSQDIDILKIAAMARKKQPGLLVIDRTVHGPYENYQTPEQRIPDHKIDNPWESCMTLGGAWGYVPNESFKSAPKVIASLIEIVAKGGSLLLGVGPGADGSLQQPIIDRLTEIGKWMDANGEAIYNTRSTAIFQDGNVFFTRSKDSKKMYALMPVADGAATPSIIEWSGNIPAKGSTVTLLETRQRLKWSLVNGKVKVVLPSKLKTAAVAIAFTTS